VDAIRGVDSSGVIQRLLEYRLIRIVGRSEELGRPLLYGTTKEFLEHFGLKSIRDLPKVQELLQPEVPADVGASPASAEAAEPTEVVGQTEAAEPAEAPGPAEAVGQAEAPEAAESAATALVGPAEPVKPAAAAGAAGDPQTADSVSPAVPTRPGEQSPGDDEARGKGEEPSGEGHRPAPEPPASPPPAGTAPSA